MVAPDHLLHVGLARQQLLRVLLHRVVQELLQVCDTLVYRSMVCLAQLSLTLELLLDRSVMCVTSTLLLGYEFLRMCLPRRLLACKQLLNRAVVLRTCELLAANDLPELVNLCLPGRHLPGELRKQFLLKLNEAIAEGVMVAPDHLLHVRV